MNRLAPLALAALLAGAPANLPAAQPEQPAPKAAEPEAGWRDMLRAYIDLRDTRADCTARFPSVDPEVARLGVAFARTAYPKNHDLGCKNFLRLVLRLRLAHPDADRRAAIFTPNKAPWPGYAGPVDSDGLAHFLFNSGTLPLPLLDHPIVPIVRSHDVKYARVKPVSQCAARVLRREQADIGRIENDPVARAALVAKIRKAFDAENASSPMSDEEARCLAACLPYMA